MRGGNVKRAEEGALFFFRPPFSPIFAFPHICSRSCVCGAPWGWRRYAPARGRERGELCTALPSDTPPPPSPSSRPTMQARVTPYAEPSARNSSGSFPSPPRPFCCSASAPLLRACTAAARLHRCCAPPPSGPSDHSAGAIAARKRLNAERLALEAEKVPFFSHPILPTCHTPFSLHATFF